MWERVLKVVLSDSEWCSLRAPPCGDNKYCTAGI